jgi:hypothetical protein
LVVRSFVDAFELEGRQEMSIVDPTRSVEKVSMRISPNAGP